MPKDLLVFDIDGVLAKLTLGLTTLGHDLFGTEIVEDDDQPNWSFDNVMTPDQQRRVWNEIDAHPDFWGTLDVLAYPHDINLMHAFANGLTNFELLYLTNRSGKRVGEVTKEWLWRNGFPYGRVELVKDKTAYLIGQQRALRRVAGILEDSPRNLEEMWAAGLPAWCFARGYNEDVTGPRVGTINQFLHQVSARVAVEHKYEEEE